MAAQLLTRHQKRAPPPLDSTSTVQPDEHPLDNVAFQAPGAIERKRSINHTDFKMGRALSGGTGKQFHDNKPP